MLSWLFGHAMESLRSQGVPRDGRWPTFEHRLIASHPFCACCGQTNIKTLEGHHIQPFHEHPEFELDADNVIILCGYRSNSCHRLIGHGGNFRLINATVKEDIAYLAAMYQRIRA